MIRNSTTFVLAMSIAATLLGAGLAEAVDNKLYAGSECVRWGGGPLGYWWSAVTAPGASIYIDCPIIRDHFDKGGSFPLEFPTMKGMLRQAKVMFIDQHPYARLSCSLVAASTPVDGTVRAFVKPPTNWNDLATYSSERQIMRFDASKEWIDAGQHSFLSCYVPAVIYGRLSSINSYTVMERTD